MNRTAKMSFAGLLLFLSVGAWVQSPDLKATIDETVSIAPATAIVNSASTGVSVDRSGYFGVMLYGQSGVVDNVATVGYLVLQDSGTAWAAVDSVLVDSVNNKAYEINYTGTKRYVRAVQRATAQAADSLWLSVAFILTSKRSR